MAEISRGQFLRLGAMGVAGAAGAGVLARPAAAALPAVTPQGDDVGFLSFGAVAEGTSGAWYEQALRVRGFSSGERRRLDAARAAKRDHVSRLNAALGADAIGPGDFASTFPARAFDTPDRAVAIGAGIEELLVRTYLNGAAFARDSGTRLMLGRLLTYDTSMLAWLRGLRGELPASGLAVPVSLEQGGVLLDRLITTPSFPA